MTPTIRRIKPSDTASVLAIEAAVFSNAWDEQLLRTLMCRTDVSGYVAVDGDAVLGFLVYRLYSSHFEVINLAVDPQFQRKGVGAVLLDQLARRLMPGGRWRIVLTADEHKEGVLTFLQACGYRATGLERNAFSDPDRDGYVFERRLDWTGSKAGFFWDRKGLLP